MLIRSAPSACAMPAITPAGRGRARAAAAARRRPRRPSRAGGAGSRMPRRSSERGSRRRRPRARPRAARPGGGARRATPPAPRGSRGRCRPRSCGFAPATRVMSRSEPPAASSGSCPSTLPPPAWFRSTFASACGRWLVTATSRSCASGSIATGTAPSDGDEPVQHLVAVRIGRGDGRQEPGRALEELGRRPFRPARLGAADRVAADEAADARSGRADAALGRADVGDGHRRRARVQHRPHLRRQRGNGSGDDGEVGSVERRREVGGRLDGAAFGGRREMRPDPDPSRARPRRPPAARPARPTRRSGPCRRSRRAAHPIVLPSSEASARISCAKSANSPAGSAAARRRAPPRAAGAPRR